MTTLWLGVPTQHGGAMIEITEAVDALTDDILIAARGDSLIGLDIASLTPLLRLAVAGEPGEAGLMTGPEKTAITSLLPLVELAPVLGDVAAAWPSGLPTVHVYTLAGGTPGSPLGIGAAFGALAITLEPDDLAFALYADLLLVCVDRGFATSDGGWIALAPTTLLGAGGIADAPNDGAAYIRKSLGWSYGVEAITLASGAAYGVVAIDLGDLTTVDLATVAPEPFDVLMFDGDDWIPGVLAPPGISDAPENGNAYGRLDASWVPVSEAAHNHALTELADVNTVPPTNGQFPRYNGATGLFDWVFETSSAGPLGGLTNVDDGVDTAPNGHILIKRASGWTHESPALPGSITNISHRLTGPATHRIVSGDIDSAIIADAASGIITIEFDDTLTSGDDHIVSGLICVEASNATNYVQFVGVSTTTGPGDVPVVENAEDPGGCHNRNSSTGTLAAGDFGPYNVDLPVCANACLVIFAHFMVPGANTQGAGRPTVKYDGTTRAWTRLHVWSDDGTTTGPPPMVGMFVLPLGDLSASAVKAITHTIGASQFNGLGGTAVIVSGVDQASPIADQDSAVSNTAAAAVALALQPGGVNRLGLWYAVKRNFGTVNPPTGANEPAAPVVSGSGVTLVMDWTPIDPSLGAGIASIFNTNCQGALAKASMSADLTATITFPTTQDTSIIGVALKPADVAAAPMVVSTPNNVPATLKQPKLMATWLYEGPPNRRVRLGF